MSSQFPPKRTATELAATRHERRPPITGDKPYGAKPRPQVPASRRGK